MALGTIQKISMAELLMTQHKSRSELFSAAQWLEAIRKRSGLSGTTIFEMAAEPSGRSMATSLGGSFCRWMLVLMFFSMNQHRNSMSTTRYRLEVGQVSHEGSDWFCWIGCVQSLHGARCDV